ncbi:MAG: beta-glucuronidase [Lachnospiraceae bacterium]|nr:beta-glucuronidase [Lachnospiraceae bacterium]
MIRLFEQHRIRNQKELEGIWDFVTEDGRKYSLTVPGCWEQHPELINYRGKGTYTKKVYVSQKTNLRLEFKGVSHTADVYLDNVFVMHHYNAFTPFAGIIRGVQPGEHVIRVEVDNSFNEKSALHIPNDYYTYGGLTRPVVLEEIADVYIENIHFTPKLEADKWTGEIEVWTRNIADTTANVDIICEFAGEHIAEKDIQITASTNKCIVIKHSFEKVAPWSIENPKLYMLNMQLMQDGQIIDDLIERVGFREVSWEGTRLCLNGTPVFLHGFNRHEDYGVIGCAIPPQLMMQDMNLMQDMGANAVRTCHYPNDERFLDLCDERGMLVWEENHARGLDLERMQNPHFDEQCKDCIDEMITNHYNHPSIVIWGILNECASETEEGREKYKMQYEQIKELDKTRPTTSATCRHFTDICLDLPDVVSFNMYSGWYQDVSVLERHNKEMDWIATAGGAGKPIIVSEFGAAAMYGYRDRGRSKWSEERQADIIEENLRVYKEDDRLTGIFIWQFADCRVTEEGGWFATRARSHNNKGVVDEYRRPKEAYDVVKQWFTNWEKK